MSRRAIVRTLMNAREKDFDLARRYRVRGPLTIAQVETEFFGKPLDSLSRTGISENTDPGYMEWEQIMKSNHRDGDELYFVTSDKRSWARLAGWRGYVLVRGNELVAVFTTAVN